MYEGSEAKGRPHADLLRQLSEEGESAEWRYILYYFISSPGKRFEKGFGKGGNKVSSSKGWNHERDYGQDP